MFNFNSNNDIKANENLTFYVMKNKIKNFLDKCNNATDFHCDLMRRARHHEVAANKKTVFFISTNRLLAILLTLRYTFLIQAGL